MRGCASGSIWRHVAAANVNTVFILLNPKVDFKMVVAQGLLVCKSAWLALLIFAD